VQDAPFVAVDDVAFGGAEETKLGLSSVVEVAFGVVGTQVWLEVSLDVVGVEVELVHREGERELVVVAEFVFGEDELVLEIQHVAERVNPVAATIDRTANLID